MSKLLAAVLRGEVPPGRTPEFCAKVAAHHRRHAETRAVGSPPNFAAVFAPAELALVTDGLDDPTLIGNRIAAITTRFGLPPCDGCNSRKRWLNRVHAWLRGESPPAPPPSPPELATVYATIIRHGEPIVIDAPLAAYGQCGYRWEGVSALGKRASCDLDYELGMPRLLWNGGLTLLMTQISCDPFHAEPSDENDNGSAEWEGSYIIE
jgi:hypothetical protein